MCLSSTCPRCGYQPDEPYSASPSDHLLDENHILERAQQIEGIIERLQRERIELLRQGHNRLKATTKALPNEILSNIFQFAHPVFDVEYCPFFGPRAEFDKPEHDSRHRTMKQHLSRLTLGAVSSHWRRTTWSTPYLWRSLILDLNLSNVNQCATVLELFIENARGLPFSLGLDFRGLPELDGDTRGLEPIRNVLLVGHAERLKDLQLISPPTEWLPLIATRFTTLEGLSLAWPKNPGFFAEEPPRPLSHEDFPHLQRLTISFLEYNIPTPIVLKWSTITDLVLERLDTDMLIQFLAQCKICDHFNLIVPMVHGTQIGNYR